MSDQQGVFCIVIFGQDSRTRITKDTQKVLCALYEPININVEVIEMHLKDLEQNLSLVFPQAKTPLTGRFTMLVQPVEVISGI